MKSMIHAFTVKSQLHNRFQESSSIINDQCHSAQVPHLISETVVFLDSNFDCNLLASRTVNLQDFFGMIVKIVGVVYFETLVRKAGVPSRLITWPVQPLVRHWLYRSASSLFRSTDANLTLLGWTPTYLMHHQLIEYFVAVFT